MDTGWVDVKGFDKYGVNRDGEVVNYRTGNTLSVSRTQAGLPKVGLVHEGKQYTRSVALIVAEAFIEKPFDFFNTPIHLDGDRMNCRADNLLWRPLWFARKYHAQFFFPYFRFGTPKLYVVETGEHFDNWMAPCIKYGILAEDITRSYTEGKTVYPADLNFRKE